MKVAKIKTTLKAIIMRKETHSIQDLTNNKNNQIYNNNKNKIYSKFKLKVNR